MSALIDNVLDFARGRLGGGIRAPTLASIAGAILTQVIAELRDLFACSGKSRPSSI